MGAKKWIKIMQGVVESLNIYSAYLNADQMIQKGRTGKMNRLMPTI